MRLLTVFIFIYTAFALGQEKPAVVLTLGHNDMIHDLVFSPNGKFFASSSNEKVIKIWDVASDMEFRSFSGFNGHIEKMCFSPNSIDLVGTSSSNELFICNVITGDIAFKGKSGTGFGLGFLKSGTEVMYLNALNYLSVLNLETDETKVLADLMFMSLALSPTENYAFGLDYKGDLCKIDLQTMTVVKTYVLFDAPKYPSSISEISKDGRLLAMGFNDNVLRIFDIEKEKFVYESEEYESSPQTLSFDAVRPFLYYSTFDNGTYLYNYHDKTTEKLVVPQIEPFSIQSIASHPKGEIVLFASYNEIVFFDTKTKIPFKKIASLKGKVYDLAYHPTTNRLAVATDQMNIQIWDLKYNRFVDELRAMFPCVFTQDGSGLIAVNSQLNLAVFDVENGRQVKEYETSGELIQAVCISADGSKIAGAGFKNTIKIWDMASTHQIANLAGHSGEIITLDFSPDGRYIASGSYDATSRVWDIETQKEVKRFVDQTIVIGGVKFSPDGKILATASWDKSINLRNVEDWSLHKKLIGHQNMINSIAFSPDNKVLLSAAGNNSVANADNRVIAWDIAAGEFSCKGVPHETQLIRVIPDAQGTRYFSVSVDGTINYADYEKCELIATYRAGKNKEFMIYTPDNYYMANKDMANKIAFRLNDELLPFEQYDVLLNRPDILAKRIGKSDDNVIDAYYYLYKKRLKRLKLDESKLALDFNLPQIKVNMDFELITQQNEQEFFVTLTDEFHALKQLNVLVNGVPIYGEKGLPIKGKKRTAQLKFTVPLTDSVNYILVSCMNEIGVESRYQNIKIIRTGAAEKQNLYILSIGVSNYKDARYNLVYPVLDAQAIMNKFSAQTNMYAHIYSKTLLNEQVVLGSLPSIYKFFETCTPQDFAVIFIAGHGVLNVDLNYFFGTYDMDFENPSARGLEYEKLYALLANIKALRKLLVMDTCHSGELDKDEIARITVREERESTAIQFRNGTLGVRKKEGVGVDNTLSIAEDFFADIRRGSGANVISSAGGTEFAIEGSDWGNGLFTHFFLEALEHPENVGNKDGVVTLSELKAYVNEQVLKASNQQQKPSSREENLSVDYIIYKR